MIYMSISNRWSSYEKSYRGTVKANTNFAGNFS